MEKSLRYLTASDRAWVIICLPSGNFPVMTMPMARSTLKILGLVCSTCSLERICFSEARMTPSLHLTPRMVLD